MFLDSMVKTEKGRANDIFVLDFTVPGSADCRLLRTTSISMAKRRFRLEFSVGTIFFRYESLNLELPQGQATWWRDAAGTAR